MACGVVETPGGAHFTSCVPDYGRDKAFQAEYAKPLPARRGAAQIDRFGNQNISAIGDWARPKAQLLGVRGAPGNTISHPVSYWVPKHSPRVFVERVDMVSGIGYDRVPPCHEIRRVVTDKAVLDFQTPDHSMRLRSVHPRVTADQVQELTGFALTIPDDVAVTPEPTEAELALIRERLDPAGLREAELR